MTAADDGSGGCLNGVVRKFKKPRHIEERMLTLEKVLQRGLEYIVRKATTIIMSSTVGRPTIASVRAPMVSKMTVQI